MSADLIGWFSTAVLIATVGRQAFTQWKEKSSQGVSRWLFIGQLTASTGFVIYSALEGNAVFVVSNIFLLIIAATGQFLLIRNRRAERKGSNGAERENFSNEFNEAGSTAFVRYDQPES